MPFSSCSAHSAESVSQEGNQEERKVVNMRQQQQIGGSKDDSGSGSKDDNKLQKKGRDKHGRPRGMHRHHHHHHDHKRIHNGVDSGHARGALRGLPDGHTRSGQQPHHQTLSKTTARTKNRNEVGTRSPNSEFFTWRFHFGKDEHENAHASADPRYWRGPGGCFFRRLHRLFSPYRSRRKLDLEKAHSPDGSQVPRESFWDGVFQQPTDLEETEFGASSPLGEKQDSEEWAPGSALLIIPIVLCGNLVFFSVLATLVVRAAAPRQDMSDAEIGSKTGMVVGMFASMLFCTILNMLWISTWAVLLVAFLIRKHIVRLGCAMGAAISIAVSSTFMGIVLFDVLGSVSSNGGQSLYLKMLILLAITCSLCGIVVLVAAGRAAKRLLRLRRQRGAGSDTGDRHDGHGSNVHGYAPLPQSEYLVNQQIQSAPPGYFTDEHQLLPAQFLRHHDEEVPQQQPAFYGSRQDDLHTMRHVFRDQASHLTTPAHPSAPFYYDAGNIQQQQGHPPLLVPVPRPY